MCDGPEWIRCGSSGRHVENVQSSSRRRTPDGRARKVEAEAQESEVVEVEETEQRGAALSPAPAPVLVLVHARVRLVSNGEASGLA